MVLDIKKHRILLVTSMLLIFLILYWTFVVPTDCQLVSTPSTHKNIYHLSADSAHLAGNRWLRFAVYDADCDVVQLCFSLKKGDRDLWDGEKIILTVDGEERGKYSMFAHTTWKRTYFSFLIEDVSEGSLITFTYNGQTISIE